MYILFPILFLMVYHRVWNIPVLYSRHLLFIHSVYNSLHLLTQTPNPSFPHPPSTLANTTLFVRESVS